MFSKPQQEHRWLDKLLGSWAAETECKMGPDQPPQKSSSTLQVRSLAGLWIVGEGSGTCPENGPWNTMMTIGYDITSSRYVGTFVASMMDRLWIYSGSVDSSGRVLVLDTEGPKFDQSGTARYQDIIELVDDDHWIMKSQILGDDGAWQPFMQSHHRRTK